MKSLIGSKSRLLFGITLIFGLIAISNSCSKSSAYNTPQGNNSGNNTGGSGGTVPGANEVWIQNMTFNPSTISVTAGTTITWTNKDAIGHTVTSDAGLFDSGVIATNGTYQYTFSTTGSYAYHCKIHPGMTASVTVTASSVTSPGY
jgi:plastocyanin